MNTTTLLAKHLHDVHFGGNWTWSNLNDQLKDVDWEQATTRIGDLNTIAVLTYHINFYVSAIIKVLKGEPLSAHDRDAFNCPPVNNESDWQTLKNKALKESEELSALIAALPDDKLWDVFAAEKYGHYFRNILGLIEHTHYHLGQIAVLKKLIHQK